MMEHRRGASFDYMLKSPFVNPDGSVFDLTGCTLTSKIRHMPTATLIDCGTIGTSLISGEWFLQFNVAGNLTDTTAWALGNVEQDICLTTGAGKKVYTPVFRFTITDGPT